MLTCGRGGVHRVFDDELTTFLQSGCALIVAFARDDGSPLASRGWGLDVLDPAAGRIRLLAVPDDLDRVVAGGPVGARVAVTGADVRTLRSVQLKGRVEAVEPATDADWERFAAYCDDFLGDIEAVDRFPKEMMARTAAVRIVACTIVVQEMYDQTPGPGAGATLAGASR